MSVAELLIISMNLAAAFAVATFCLRRDRDLVPAMRLAEVLRDPLSGLPAQN
jgi:hypothetical protein